MFSRLSWSRSNRVQPPAKRVLNGDNLPPLSIVAELTTGERAVTDVNVDAVGDTAASLVEQLARPERVSTVRQRGGVEK
jgi:hypothetical protein